MTRAADFVSAVSVGDRAALTARRDAPGLVRLAIHLGAIGLLGAAIVIAPPGWWLLLPLQGVLIAALFMLAHEATHQTPFRTRWLNEAAGHLAGLALLLPFRWFRAFHMAHHRWTNLPGRDPELAMESPQGWRGWVIYLSGLPYWREMIGVILRLALGRETAPWLGQRARRAAQWEARAMLLIYLVLALTAPWLLWVWVIPAILGQPALRLYLLAEHGDCPQVAEMFDNTRTTYTHAALRWLTWNMPYHTEHHVWPAVPFHQLPALHERMRGQLRQTAPGYRAFTRAYLSRRLRPGAEAATPDAGKEGTGS